ncbi:hypothetical protein [Nocardia jejuensis]|uniref:hypothetical protein n=1 Tax=Nocardia jejuensis TaxID=328049 RepID=UPI00082D5809|nr:hypothetical protein [Nocardia jejuensis]
MVRIAVAAEEPDEQGDPGASSDPASLRPHLEVVPESPDLDAPQPHSFGANVLAETDIERLPSSVRHRIAAFIHLQVAALEEMPEPTLPPLSATEDL